MPRYLNTDLDLVSTDDLSALADALKRRGIFPLHVERGDDGLWRARLEARNQHDSIEPTVAAILSAIERLENDEGWTRCAQRELSIGCESGSGPPVLEEALADPARPHGRRPIVAEDRLL